MQLNGLHHVTAITGQAGQNLTFYTQELGMRLVKKTVNQDDVSAYHLFYGDEAGQAGTEVTFFDWPHTPPNKNGAGSIARIGLRVSGDETLDWWEKRLAENGVKQMRVSENGRQNVLRFRDPEGLELELANDKGVPGGTPWKGSPVPAELGIRGLYSVTLMVSNLEPTAQTLTQVLGFSEAREYLEQGDPNRRVVVFTSTEGGPGNEVHVESGPHLPRTQLGRGGVHHVAFRTSDAESQLAWREHISASGLGVTPVIDRFYFKSIYFRIPGGILFEIATDGPGFATDEDPEHLGESLALPPFLEPRRAEIEAGLKPI